MGTASKEVLTPIGLVILTLIPNKPDKNYLVKSGIVIGAGAKFL